MSNDLRKKIFLRGKNGAFLLKKLPSNAKQFLVTVKIVDYTSVYSFFNIQLLPKEYVIKCKI